MVLDYLENIIVDFGIKMISYYYYWKASQNLRESDKTMQMMKPDVPVMIEAQHEMNVLEFVYWERQSRKFTIMLLIFCFVSIIIYTLMRYYYV